MSRKRDKLKVLSRTSGKTIIRNLELVNVLNATEISQWHSIIRKIEIYDARERERRE